MLFDSPAYFLFLIPVVLLYWRLNQRAQNVFLLLASYFFYGWGDWRFLALMIASTTVDFLFAQKIAPPSRSDPTRRNWLFFSIFLIFTFLGFLNTLTSSRSPSWEPSTNLAFTIFHYP